MDSDEELESPRNRTVAATTAAAATTATTLANCGRTIRNEIAADPCGRHESAAFASPAMLPRLPTGAVIDSKNTLQFHCPMPLTKQQRGCNSPSTGSPALLVNSQNKRSKGKAGNNEATGIKKMQGGSLSTALSGPTLSSLTNPAFSTTGDTCVASLVHAPAGDDRDVSDTDRLTLIEAHFLYGPDGQYLAAPVPLPMQVADGEVATRTIHVMAWWKRRTNVYGLVGLLLIAIVAAVVAIIATTICPPEGCIRQGNNDAIPQATVMPKSASPTDEPTAPLFNATTNPTSARAQNVVEFINSITLTGQNMTLFDSPIGATVEEMALLWLIQDDPLQLSPNSTINQFRLQQRYALATLWALLPNFVAGYDDARHDECSWRGITCHRTDMGIAVGIQDAVTAIQLSNANWTGQISADLGLLEFMVHFDMSSNALTGSLPSSIGQKWTNLESFDVHYNTLTGSLPDSVGEWTKLELFNIALNTAMTGSLPESIGQWTEVEYVDMDSNRIMGSLPSSLGRWANLEYFYMSYNQLTGSLPSSIGQWTDILSFAMAENSWVTGTLPASLGNWTNVELFEVQRNQLRGSLPSTLETWSKLKQIDVSGNGLSGELPYAMDGWFSLIQGEFGENDFGGIVPLGLCNNAANLTHIVVDCNKVTCTCASECQCSTP